MRKATGSKVTALAGFRADLADDTMRYLRVRHQVNVLSQVQCLHSLRPDSGPAKEASNDSYENNQEGYLKNIRTYIYEQLTSLIGFKSKSPKLPHMFDSTVSRDKV